MNTRDFAELERRYRRLLLAYPRDYRELRTEEMLATLLDDAAADQRRPTREEIVDLVIGGVRQRLRLPPLPLVWVGALLSALIFGAFAAAVAGALGWGTAGGLPDNQAATGLVTSAFAPRPGVVTTRHDRLFGYDTTLTPNDPRVLFMGDDNYSAGYVQLIGYPDEQHDLETAAAALRGSGWRVDPVREEPGSTVLTASTARLSLQARLRPSDNRLVVTIHRAPPPWIGPLTVIGWIAGALAGWMLAGVLARRASRQSPVVQLGIQTAVMFGLVFLTPVTAVVTTALAHAVIAPASSWLSPPWSAYTYPILRPVALAGAVFAIVAAGLATVAPRHHDVADGADAPSPTPIS